MSRFENVPRKAQPLVNAPESIPAGYEKLLFSTDSGAAWTETVPAGRDAGKYTILYKYTGSEGGEDSNTQALTVTIKKAVITITASDRTSKKGGDLKKLKSRVTGDYVKGDDLGIRLSTRAKKNRPGKYTIKVSWNRDPNYKAVLKKGIYTVKDAVTMTEQKKAKAALDSGLAITRKNKSSSNSSSLKVSWGAVSNADRYAVYVSYPDKTGYSRARTVNGKKQSALISRINGKKIPANRPVKAYIAAYRRIDGKYLQIARSRTVYI